MFFEVSNGEPPASACDVGPVMTHAAAGYAASVSRKLVAGKTVVSATTSPTTGTAGLVPPTPTTNQRAAVFTYDLSFLRVPAGLSAASIWVYVQEDGGVAGATVQAYGFDAAAAPCLEPPCALLGSAALAATGHWTEVALSPEYVTGRLRCKGAMTLALVLPAVSVFFF